MNAVKVFEGARLLVAKDSIEYDKLAKTLTEAEFTPASNVTLQDGMFFQEWHKIGVRNMEPAIRPVSVMPGGLK